MQKTSLIPLLVIIISSAPTVSCQCPVGCFCLAGYVTCSDLKSIPSAFPADTRSLSITNINADEIPAGVFDKLPAIETIEIYLGKIGKISTGAFSSLSYLDLISLNELTIGTIEQYAFSNITDIGTISIYMSKIDTIKPYAFWNIFALDDIKLFMIDVAKIDSFALTDIDELYHFSFYTNTIGSMQPYAFSNFANVHKLSMYLNDFGHLGCGTIEALVAETYEHSFYSNSVNCSCDLAWIPTDDSLKKFLFSNWCQVPDTDEKVYWEDISPDTLQCDSEENDVCPPAAEYELTVAPSATTHVPTEYEPASTTHSVPDFTSLSTSKLMADETTTLHAGISQSVETSSAVPKHSSLSSVTSSTSDYVSKQSSSPSEQTATSPIETSAKTSGPPGPPSEKSTRQTQAILNTATASINSISSTSINSISSASINSISSTSISSISSASINSISSASINSISSTTAASTVTDATLVSTELVQYSTNQKVVISNETEIIKAATSTTVSTNKPQSQNVSFRGDDDVNGSTQIRGCFYVLVLTLVVTVI